MKKYWKIIVILLLVVVLISGSIILFKNADSKKKNSVTTTVVPTVVLNDSGIPKYIDGSYVNETIKNEEEIFEILNSLSEVYGFEEAADEFKLVSTSESEGMKYYRLQQVYKSLEVYNYQLVVAVDKDNKISSITGQYYPNIDVSTYSGLSKSEAQEELESTYEEGTYEILESDKYVYISENGPITSYIFSVIGDDGYNDIVVSMKDGCILQKYNTMSLAAYQYTGKGVDGQDYTVTLEQDSNHYSFYDTKRNIKIIDAYDIPGDKGSIENRKWINIIVSAFHAGFGTSPITTEMTEEGILSYKVLSAGTLQDVSDRLPTAVTAMNNIATVYDYYKSLGRISFDGAGAEIRVNIGLINDLISLGNNEYYNAFWDGSAFYFGSHNGVSLAYSLDVLAHEFTHAVSECIVNFESKNESGALNESYSDIMASLIEGKNFTINENIDIMRDMENPNAYGDPMVKGGKYYFPDDRETYNDAWIENMLKEEEKAGSPISNWLDWDKGGIHHNNGVPNHAAYLMYSNGAFDSKFQMAKVWYNSLYYLVPKADFEDCALAVIKSAENLGLSEEKIQIITDAFYETNMLERTYNLSGTVIDEDTEEVLEGVTVSAIFKENTNVYFETLTDENGKYTFEKLKAQDYIITFEKSKYENNEMELSLTDNVDSFDAEMTPIEEAEYDEYEVVFVMDISMSMDENDPEDVRKQIIVNIVSSMDSNASAALVTFAKNANTVNNGLSAKEVDKRVLMTDVFNIANDSGTTENSGTNGKAGLGKAISLLDEETEKRKYIVFLTDGEDNVSDERTYDDLTEKANDLGIRVITIGLGSSVDTSELKQIASKTNGKYYYASKSSDLHKFDKKIFDELK